MIRSHLCLGSEFLIKAMVVKSTLEFILTFWQATGSLYGSMSPRNLSSSFWERKENKQEQNLNQEQELLAAEEPKWCKKPLQQQQINLQATQAAQVSSVRLASSFQQGEEEKQSEMSQHVPMPVNKRGEKRVQNALKTWSNEEMGGKYPMWVRVCMYYCAHLHVCVC